MRIFYAETVKICTTASEHNFYAENCVAASGNISMFSKERTATSEKISMCDCFFNKTCSCFLELCSFKKYFKVEKQIKIKNDGNIFFTSETRYFYVFLAELLQ